MHAHTCIHARTHLHTHTHTHKVRKLDAGFSWDRKHCEMRKVFSFVFKDKQLSSAWDQGGVTVAWLTDILITVQNNILCHLIHRHPDHCTKQNLTSWPAQGFDSILVNTVTSCLLGCSEFEWPISQGITMTYVRPMLSMIQRSVSTETSDLSILSLIHITIQSTQWLLTCSS